MIGIYKFTNLINGKIYIGQSRNIERRYKDHLNRAKNNFASNNEYNTLIHKAIRKYGIKNFSFEILEECSIEELNNKEEYWINYYNSFSEKGYNLNSGGNQNEQSRKFDDAFIEKIQYLLQNTTKTYDEIHNEYNISTGRISEINTGKLNFNENLSYPLRKKEKKYNTCKNCGKIIDKKAILCVKCFNIARRIVDRPEREELKNLIRIKPFTQIAEKYNVTDNTIRKWCDAENLPRTKKEIKAYSDEEWVKI